MFRRRGHCALAMFACLVAQAVMHASMAAEPADRQDDATPPFGITYEMPYGGFTAAHVYDRDGTKLIRRLAAEIARQPGDVREAWDLRDDAGRLTHSNSPDPLPPYNNIGFQILKPEILGDRTGAFSIVPIWKQLSAEGRLFGAVTTAEVIHVSDPAGRDYANRRLAEAGA